MSRQAEGQEAACGAALRGGRGVVVTEFGASRGSGLCLPDSDGHAGEPAATYRYCGCPSGGRRAAAGYPPGTHSHGSCSSGFH